MRSNFYLLVVLGLLGCFQSYALVGEKRTILTSGEKVHTIRYQLGQSTVIYFGMKPETVICGNKNYFHIDKIKEGITIQAGSNFSTNLTVLSQGRRFLFYLTPANAAKPDTFVEIRWIPPREAKRLLTSTAGSKQIVRDIKGHLKMRGLDVSLIREITASNTKRTILEFEVKNSGNDLMKTASIQIELQKAGRPIPRQVALFELEELKPNVSSKGRVIITGSALKGSSITVKYQGTTGSIQGVVY